MNAAESWCEKVLNYQFSDSDLLAQALTHKSASRDNNERLEFLGDAVLDLVISQKLFADLPAVSEYGMTRHRSELVRKESLAELAADAGLARHITVSCGESRSGLRNRDSVLANCLEAILGAVFLDGGYPAAYRVISKIYADRLANLPAEEALKDAKTRLQEYLQARQKPLPEYAIVEVYGADHARTVEVVCRLTDPAIETTARDTSRRRAEQTAASMVLEAIAGD